MVEGWVTEEEIREIAYNSVYSVYSVVDKVASVRTRHASRRILPMCSLEFMQLYFPLAECLSKWYNVHA